MQKQQIKIDIHREIADRYQGLFNLMIVEHNLILTISEMDEIITEAQKVVTKNSQNGNKSKNSSSSSFTRSRESSF